MKKITALLLIVALLPTYSAFAMSKNEPLKKLGAGVNDVTYGAIEVPDNIDETHTKGQKAYPDCTDATKDGVGRAIAKIVGGAWKMATFWYPEDE